MEVMVALLVFMIAVPPLANSFLTAYRTTAQNRYAVLAADLVSQALDGVRSVPFADVAIGSTTTTQTVQNLAFTITQTVAPIAPPEQSTDVCGASTTGTGNDDYLLVSVAVSWPYDAAAPVMARTMLAPPATVIASGDAEVIIQVFSADGNPAIGVPVAINTTPSPTVVTTNSNGCAAFPYLNAGQSYTLTASGYVNPSQAAASITTPVLSLNQTYEQTAGITWDLPTTLDGPVQTQCVRTSPLTYTVCNTTTDVIYPSSCTAGASPCSGPGMAADPIPVVFVPNGSAPARVISGATATTQASTTGFPFITNYQAWAGTCADAQPASNFVEGLTAVPGQAAPIWPGNPMVNLFAQDLTSSSYGKVVTVSHAADANCTSGETYSYTVPATLPSGATAMAVAVPAGIWTFKAGTGTPQSNVPIPPISSTGLAL